MESQHLLNFASEIVDDIIDGVKTPPPEPLDLTDPKVCCEVFEENNKDMNLWYNPMIMNWWWNLQQGIEKALIGHVDAV